MRTFYHNYLSIIALLVCIYSFNITVFCQDLSKPIHTIDESVSGIVNIPTESIFILNEIIASRDYSLSANTIDSLRTKVNVTNATKVFQSIDNIFYQRKMLNISDRDIYKSLYSYINYHNEIFGNMPEQLYYETANLLKDINDKKIESFIVEIVKVWLMNSDIQDKNKTINHISNLLTLNNSSSNLLILFNISHLMDKSELFELMDRVERNNPNNIELINGLKQFRKNILYPEQIPKWHVIH